jgi:hypothetical protein
LERIMNLITDPEFESLCPPLSEERDATCDEAQEARAEADRDAELHDDRAWLQTDADRLASELAQARRP